MKRCALICAVFLCSIAFSYGYAASPDTIWQDYQKHPGYVSNQPTKPAQTTVPRVTIEAQDGSVSEPTTPEQAKDKAEVHPSDAQKAQNNVQETNTSNETADEPVNSPKADSEPEAEPTNETMASSEPVSNAQEAEQGDASVFAETASSQPATTSVIGNKPVAPANKPKPKLNLVGKPPLPKQFMRTPQAGDFEIINSVNGSYSIALPRTFGADPLAALPKAEGAMLVRTAADDLMCAITMLDAADTLSYNATQTLPIYENKKIYWTWKHDAALTWNCTLSSHNDYHGDKILFEAQAEQNGKTYQMLFVMPANRYTDLLPQAIYALNSFKLNS